MSKVERIRVLLVDDHPVVRSGLRDIQDLCPQIKVVGEAASGAEAIAQARRLQPDLVLLDYRLPDLGGGEVCAQIKAQQPSPRVLFLSSFAAEDTVGAALDAGADGYLLKENDAQKIVDAILAIHHGGMCIDPAIARATIRRSQPNPEPVRGLLDTLTLQERKVLTALATGKTDKEIAQSVQLEPKTVRNYLAHVYEKLGVRSRTQAALLYQRLAGEDAKTP
jgi:DNA-binding NarL/FixJ family response regulator